MHESAKNSADPRNYKDLSSAVYESEHRASTVTVVKNRSAGFRKKSYWCAPRKAGNESLEKKAEDLPVKTDVEKPRKKRRKKARPRKLRRIDVLAQPKSQNRLLDQKERSTVIRSTRKCRILKFPAANGNKTPGPLESDKGFMLQQLSKMMRSKKFQRRLFALVTKKIKEQRICGTG